jgi:hypothetical protein
MNIEIIFDNGGGITIQNTDDPYYIHYYDDATQAAQDIIDLNNGGDTAEWDGNEYEDYMSTQRQAAEEYGDDPDDVPDDAALIDPSYDDIHNGGYRVFTLGKIMDAVDDPGGDDHISWGNVLEVVQRVRAASESAGAEERKRRK